MKIFPFMCIFIGTNALSISTKCARLLELNHARSIQAYTSYQMGFYQSKFSMEYSRATAYTGRTPTELDNVISFGSGPDIYTPILNFPMANKIHLVDLFTGWGLGSGNVVFEIVQRAKFLHPTAKVRLKKAGFSQLWPKSRQSQLRELFRAEKERQTFPEEFLGFNFWKSEYFYQNHFMQHGHKKPIVIQVSWNHEILGPISKDIYLHPINFNYPDHIEPFTSQIIEQNSLAGIVITGIGFPETVGRFLGALGPGGQAILEVYSDQVQEKALLRSLRHDPTYDVTLAHVESFRRSHEDHITKQKLYVVTKVR